MARDRGASLHRLYKRLAVLTRARPRAGLALAALAGHAAGARAGADFTLTPDEVRALFGPLSHSKASKLRRRIAGEELRNRCARALVRERGTGPLAALVRVRGAERLRELLREKVPVVAVGWHAGVFRSAPLGIARLGIPTLVATGKPLGRAAEQSDLPLRYAQMGEGAGALGGAQFLKQALAHLADGGVAFFFVDNFDVQGRIRLPFCGRLLPLARGATTLARVARGRVVPVSSRWLGLGGAIEVRIHEPLPEPAAARSGGLAWETELLARIVATFEAEARAHPERLRLWRWRELVALPPA